jgi:phage FluMu protein Com
MGQLAVRDGQLKSLQPVRCQACGRLLLRMDPDALRPGKVVETKCKCDAFTYRIGETT